MQKGDTVFYGRCNLGSFDVYELKVRTVAETWFTAMMEGGKYSTVFLFNMKNLDDFVFINRSDCLEYVKRKEKEYYG